MKGINPIRNVQEICVIKKQHILGVKITIYFETFFYNK